MPRLLRRLSLALLLVLLLGSVGAAAYVRRSLPQWSGTLAAAGLAAPVEIVRDADAVPHIFGRTADDAFFGLGYAHAQDRLWQMDFQRRIGQGRLAEILGKDALDEDRFLRTLGVYRAAEAAWRGASPGTRAAVTAYIAGINAFLATHHGSALPPEFGLLGVAPAPWTGPDVLVWSKMMAWDLGGNWSTELLRADLIRKVGAARAAELLPVADAAHADGPTIVTTAGTAATLTLPSETAPPPPLTGLAATAPRYGALLDAAEDLHALLDLGPSALGEAVGSNSWVVDGTRSRSGKPLLADDPHLTMRLPSVWYLAHLSGGELDVIGATLPGLPGVVIGRNRRIGWGLTNLGPDVQDLYQERLSADGRRAEFKGAMEPVDVVTETLRVKGAPDVVWPVRSTRHGPLISDAVNANTAAAPAELRDPETPALEPLALRWTALDPTDRTVDAILGVNRAADWAGFTAALRDLAAPSQNFVYADVDGHIGYYAPGRVPIRAGGDGSLPAEGWTGAGEWTGWVPFEAMPHAFDPPEHVIVAANNRPQPPGAAYFLGQEWASPYRAARILERLGVNPDQGSQPAGANGGDLPGSDAADVPALLSVKDMGAIQADTRSRFALEFIPRLAALVRPAGDSERQAFQMLLDWDGDTRGDSPAAALFEAWMWRLPRAIAGDELGGPGARSLDAILKAGRKGTPHPKRLIDRYEGQFAFTSRFLKHVIEDPASTWCDFTPTPLVEDCPAAVSVAFRAALADLGTVLGKDVRRWRWDRLHTAVFAHNPLGAVGLLQPLVNRELPRGGDASTVNVGVYSFDPPFEQRHGPSYRQVLDMADADAGGFIHTGGQSGQPFSDHYADYLGDWQAGRYRAMTMSRAKALQGALGVLQLVPNAPAEPRSRTPR